MLSAVAGMHCSRLFEKLHLHQSSGMVVTEMQALSKTKFITISLHSFALPVPRSGSIEAHSGYGRSAADGREIHLRVQKKRAKADLLYQAEVPVNCLFDRDGFSFRVDGRLDGIFRHELPRIGAPSMSGNFPAGLPAIRWIIRTACSC